VARSASPWSKIALGDSEEHVVTPAVVSAEALRKLLGSGEGIVILDARGRRADYDAGHLIGARHADPGEHLSSAAEPNANPERGGRHPLPDVETWRRTLGGWGISPASLVVVYDDQAGANAAARAWWMLRSVGHHGVAVLDGGLDAARSICLPMTTAAPVVDVEQPYPASGWQRPSIDLSAVDELRKDPAWIVLDVRSRERFAGETEPIDPVAGHIPGAVNLPFAENLRDGRFKTRRALRDLYEGMLGGVRPDHLIVHCGSGVTACHTLLALEHAGMNGAALYVGSWSEWCRSGKPREPEHIPADGG
jgi:thiosulfate/3-mercaptopyruvate sulfurtransferase